MTVLEVVDKINEIRNELTKLDKVLNIETPPILKKLIDEKMNSLREDITEIENMVVITNSEYDRLNEGYEKSLGDWDR